MQELIHRKLHKSESQEISEVLLHNLRRGRKLPAAWLVDLFSRWMKEIHMPLDLMGMYRFLLKICIMKSSVFQNNLADTWVIKVKAQI